MTRFVCVRCGCAWERSNARPRRYCDTCWLALRVERNAANWARYSARRRQRKAESQSAEWRQVQ